MRTEAGKLKKTAAAAGVAAFWLLVWQLLAVLIGKDVVLSPPLTVFGTLVRLMGTGEFWLTVGATFLRILLGYGLGAALGLGLGLAAWKSRIVRRLLAPFISVVRATPVASFIILLLFLARNQWIPVIIAALMVMPLVWTACLQGIEETDGALLEMGRVFELSHGWQLHHIYGPSVRAFLRPAAVSGLGLAWKAGVAAEVLAAPEHSVGGMLYRAKIYLENPEMLAWTLCVVAVSMGLERWLARKLK